VKINLDVSISKQPDNTTCGPTSLHAVYSYYNDTISLEQTIGEITQFDQGGGTLAVVLGKHAIKRGYSVTIYSFNIKIFDPSWFDKGETFIRARVRTVIEQKPQP
jgi:hypothetical protein